jgi:hypothetical protein
MPRNIPEGSSATSVILPAETKAIIKAWAAMTGQTFNEAVTKLLVQNGKELMDTLHTRFERGVEPVQGGGKVVANFEGSPVKGPTRSTKF